MVSYSKKSKIGIFFRKMRIILLVYFSYFCPITLKIN